MRNESRSGCLRLSVPRRKDRCHQRTAALLLWPNICLFWILFNKMMFSVLWCLSVAITIEGGAESYPRISWPSHFPPSCTAHVGLRNSALRLVCCGVPLNGLCYFGFPRREELYAPLEDRRRAVSCTLLHIFLVSAYVRNLYPLGWPARALDSAVFKKRFLPWNKIEMVDLGSFLYQLWNV